MPKELISPAWSGNLNGQNCIDSVECLTDAERVFLWQAPHNMDGMVLRLGFDSSSVHYYPHSLCSWVQAQVCGILKQAKVLAFALTGQRVRLLASGHSLWLYPSADGGSRDEVETGLHDT